MTDTSLDDWLDDLAGVFRRKPPARPVRPVLPVADPDRPLYPCAGLTDLFFSDRPDDQDQAKAICRGCEHAARCLDRAIATKAVGVWGGTTEQERRTMTRAA